MIVGTEKASAGSGGVRRRDAAVLGNCECPEADEKVVENRSAQEGLGPESQKTISATRRIICEREGSPRNSNPKYARNGRNERELKDYEQTKSQCKN